MPRGTLWASSKVCSASGLRGKLVIVELIAEVRREVLPDLECARLLGLGQQSQRLAAQVVFISHFWKLRLETLERQEVETAIHRPGRAIVIGLADVGYWGKPDCPSEIEVPAPGIGQLTCGNGSLPALGMPYGKPGFRQCGCCLETSTNGVKSM